VKFARTLFFLGILACEGLFAQSRALPAPQVGIGFLGAGYQGDLSTDDFAFSRVYPGINVSLQFPGKSFFQPQLNAGYGTFQAQFDNLTGSVGDISQQSPNTFVETQFFYTDIRAVIFLSRGKRLQPYLSPGAGFLFFNPRDKDGFSLIQSPFTRTEYESYPGVILSYPLTAGAKSRINDLLSVGLEGTWRIATTDYLDNIGALGSHGGNDRMYSAQGTLYFSLAALKPSQVPLPQKQPEPVSQPPVAARTPAPKKEPRPAKPGVARKRPAKPAEKQEYPALAYQKKEQELLAPAPAAPWLSVFVRDSAEVKEPLYDLFLSLYERDAAVAAKDLALHRIKMGYYKVRPIPAYHALPLAMAKRRIRPQSLKRTLIERTRSAAEALEADAAWIPRFMSDAEAVEADSVCSSYDKLPSVAPNAVQNRLRAGFYPVLAAITVRPEAPLPPPLSALTPEPPAVIPVLPPRWAIEALDADEAWIPRFMSGGYLPEPDSVFALYDKTPYPALDAGRNRLRTGYYARIRSLGGASATDMAPHALHYPPAALIPILVLPPRWAIEELHADSSWVKAYMQEGGESAREAALATYDREPASRLNTGLNRIYTGYYARIGPVIRVAVAPIAHAAIQDPETPVFAHVSVPSSPIDDEALFDEALAAQWVTVATPAQAPVATPAVAQAPAAAVEVPGKESEDVYLAQIIREAIADRDAIYYQPKKGDTIATLAERFNLPEKVLRQANGYGDKLVSPPLGKYVCIPELKNHYKTPTERDEN